MEILFGGSLFEKKEVLGKVDLSAYDWTEQFVSERKSVNDIKKVFDRAELCGTQ